MSMKFFRVTGEYPPISARTGYIPAKSFNHTGFLGCDMVQKHVMELLKEGVTLDSLRVYVDSPGGGGDVTRHHIQRALKRLGRKAP
jgi:hypothetical protein